MTQEQPRKQTKRARPFIVASKQTNSVTSYSIILLPIAVLLHFPPSNRNNKSMPQYSPHHRRPLNPFARSGTTSLRHNHRITAWTYRDNRYSSSSKGAARRSVSVVVGLCILGITLLVVVVPSQTSQTTNVVSSLLEAQDEHRFVPGQEHHPTRAPALSLRGFYEHDDEEEEESNDHSSLRKQPHPLPTPAPTQHPTDPPETDREHLPPTLPFDEEQIIVEDGRMTNNSVANTTNATWRSDDDDNEKIHNNTNSSSSRSRSSSPVEDHSSLMTRHNDTQEENTSQDNENNTNAKMATVKEEEEAVGETHQTTTNSNLDEIDEEFESESILETTENQNETELLHLNTTEDIKDESTSDFNRTESARNETLVDIGNETMVEDKRKEAYVDYLFDNNNTAPDRTKAHAVYKVISDTTDDSNSAGTGNYMTLEVDDSTNRTASQQDDSKKHAEKTTLSETDEESETISRYNSTDPLTKTEELIYTEEETLVKKNASGTLDSDDDTSKDVESLSAFHETNPTKSSIETLRNETNDTPPSFLLQNDTSDTTSDS